MFYTSVLIFLPIIIMLASSATGQTFYPGPCPPHLKPQANFNFDLYKGLWYEVEKYLFLPEIKGKCVYVRYRDLQPDNISFEADIVQVEFGTGKITPTPSYGKIVSTDGSAKINLKVHVLAPFTNIPIMKFDYPYWILETDYDDYSIKWACDEIRLLTGVVNMQSVWILSRTRNFPPGLREYIHERLRSYGLQPELLLLTDQTGCPQPPTDDYMKDPSDVTVDFVKDLNITATKQIKN